MPASPPGAPAQGASRPGKTRPPRLLPATSDAHGVDWTGDENYAHWRFGPVVRAPHQILEAVDHAIVAHWHYLRAQMEGVDVTFSTLVDPPSVRAATAIAEFLRMRVAG